MSLRAHLIPLDLGAVLGQLAGLVRMIGWLLALPAGLGWLFGEFLVAGLLSGLSVVALALGHWGRALLPKDLHLREAFVVTALAYPLFALAGAIAFLPVAPFIDGFFESMSGFTTTGLTVVHVESLPRSLRFLRAYMQWIGGAGIVILSVAVWNATRPAGYRFRMYGSATESERVAGSVHASARQLVAIYGLLTSVVCVVFSDRWNAARGRRASRACNYFYGRFFAARREHRALRIQSRSPHRDHGRHAAWAHRARSLSRRL